VVYKNSRFSTNIWSITAGWSRVINSSAEIVCNQPNFNCIVCNQPNLSRIFLVYAIIWLIRISADFFPAIRIFSYCRLGGLLTIFEIFVFRWPKFWILRIPWGCRPHKKSSNVQTTYYRTIVKNFTRIGVTVAEISDLEQKELQQI